MLTRCRGARPLLCVSDNGTELTSMAILAWCQHSKVGWHYIAPGKPQQNADRLRTVMSSIMRRRSGLISVIGGLPFQGWGAAPKPWQTEHLELSANAHRFSRVSGLVQSVRKAWQGARPVSVCSTIACSTWSSCWCW